jgi:two-component system invasion response regulator UvrY
MEKLSILLAEDHLLVRQAWRVLLEKQEDYILAGEASTGDEVVELATSLQPDVILMDINLPGISGLDATKIIKEKHPQIKVLIVSMHNQPVYAITALRYGASGYITKSSSTEEVFKAIAQIQNGQKYVCEELNGVLIGELIEEQASQSVFQKLTAQERKVMAFLKHGESSKRIAEEMNISRRTVEVHRYHILKKLNLPNTVALVSFMNKNNLDLRIA